MTRYVLKNLFCGLKLIRPCLYVRLEQKVLSLSNNDKVCSMENLHVIVYLRVSSYLAKILHYNLIHTSAHSLRKTYWKLECYK